MDLSTALRYLRNPSVTINVVAPLVAYYGLHVVGVTDVVALSVAALLPLGAIVATAVRTRHIDPIAAMSVVFIVPGVVIAFLVQDPRLLLALGGMTGLTVGLAFLGSLLTARPMIARIVRRAIENSGVPDRWDTDAAYRARCRQITTVWGLVLVGHAILHVTVALLVAPSIAAGLLPLITLATLGPTALWTGRQRERRRATDRSPVASARRS